jgi:hypothetical protein
VTGFEFVIILETHRFGEKQRSVKPILFKYLLTIFEIFRNRKKHIKYRKLYN